MLIIASLFTLARETATVVSYVKNQAFPHPLGEVEERECLAQMQQGSEEAYHRLVEHNLRLVAYIAKKFRDSGVDEDDMISLGTIGLIKAVKSFRSDAGTKFATYAARCIENEILWSNWTLVRDVGDTSIVIIRQSSTFLDRLRQEYQNFREKFVDFAKLMAIFAILPLFQAVWAVTH